MVLAIAQLNFRIADFSVIKGKIIDNIKLAQAQGANLIVFSELAIGGSPAFDFLKSSKFLSDIQNSIEDIASHCSSIDCIIGSPFKDKGTQKLYNSILFIQNKEVREVITKKHLRTDGELLESPYFQPGSGERVIVSSNRKVLITFGDDLESVEKSDDAELVLSLHNSLYSYLEFESRKKKIVSVSEKHSVPVIEVNQVGGHGSFLFEGRSVVINKDGKFVDELNAFKEDLRIFQLQDGVLKPLQPRQENVEYSEIASIHKALVFGIKDYFHKNGFTKALIGLSGGLDSALVAALACEALGENNIKGVLMPSMYSTDHSILDAKKLAENLNCEYEIIPIKEAFDTFKNLLSPVFKNAPEDVTEQNIQARVRAVLLMSISNKQGYIVLNTSNKSEAAMGYGTLYGDLIGSLSVLGDVYKTQIVELANYINRNGEVIPKHTIVKPPSAELMPDQKDSDSLPLYEVLDPILFQLIEKGLSVEEVIRLGFDENEVHRVSGIMSKVGFKLFQTPPALRVSPRAFGSGLHMPLVAKFG